MTDVVTYQDAANILGCHVYNVPKLIRKGELTSTGKRGGSFNRDQVEALAARREAERQERAKGVHLGCSRPRATRSVRSVPLVFRDLTQANRGTIERRGRGGGR